MHLDDGLRNAIFYEEARYFGALVSLQLDDFAFLWVNDDIAIASEFLEHMWIRKKNYWPNVHV